MKEHVGISKAYTNQDIFKNHIYAYRDLPQVSWHLSMRIVKITNVLVSTVASMQIIIGHTG